MHEELVLDRPSSLPSGRRALLVCPECGDFGCGVLSADVRLEEDAVRWGALAHEAPDFDDAARSQFDLEHYRNLPSMRFAIMEYRRVLAQMCGCEG